MDKNTEKNLGKVEIPQQKDIKRSFVTEDCNMDDGLYSENRNFGVIYHVFTENAKTLIQTKNGRKAIREFITKIKGNKLLKEQCDVYRLLSEYDGSGNKENYVYDVVSVVPNFDKKAIIEANNKLIGLMRKYDVNEFVDIPDEKMRVYEAIEYILLNKPDIKNITQIINSKITIAEHLTRSAKSAVQEEKKSTYSNLLDELTMKYTYTLNEEEHSLIEEYEECEDKEAFYNKHKENAINKINEAIDKEGNSENWKTSLKVLNEKIFNEKTALSDIAEMIEICEVVEEK